MTVSAIQTHLRYVGITPEDVAAMRSVQPLVQAHVDEFVKYFYDHLLAFEGTKRFLADEGKIQRLLVGQRNYVLSLFEANFDQKYYEFRRLIGHTHFRIGLDFQWYIGAYVLYLDFFVPLFVEHYSGDLTRMAAINSAFRRAALLDMSIVLEAYHEGDKAALEASQAQVAHQEKLAAVGLLASGLAHEIGNPLASIQAICDNQLRRTTDPAVAERFQRIRDQVTRITSIVRQLVGFARPMPATWQPVNLKETIEAALAIAKLSRSAKAAEVETSIDETLPSPHGIADQLSQVFLNLFLNAFDALPEHGGRLNVRTALEGADRIAVRIEDTGSGIDPKDLGKIFAPFFTTKDVGKGTGLGLHVCKGIIERHGGEIRVQSEFGKGTAFTVLLPLNKQAPEGNS